MSYTATLNGATYGTITIPQTVLTAVDSATNPNNAAALVINANKAIGSGKWSVYNPGTSVTSPATISALAVPTTFTNTTTANGQTQLVFEAGSGTVIGGSSTKQEFIGGTTDFTYITNAGNSTVALYGSSTNNDVVSTQGAGNHLIYTGDANVTVDAASGKSTVWLGAGSDDVNVAGVATVFAGTGADTVDVLFGGTAVVAFANTVAGSGGVHVVNNIGGALTVNSGFGTVTVYGADGQSGGYYAGGKAGNNYLQGGNTGSTTLVGGGSGDTLISGASKSLLTAGSGAETLISGGTGNVTLQGGSNSDVFVFTRYTSGSGVIDNFIAGDVVDLNGYGTWGVGAGRAITKETTVPTGTKLTLNGGTTITFTGVAKTDLDLSTAGQIKHT